MKTTAPATMFGRGTVATTLTLVACAVFQSGRAAPALRLRVAAVDECRQTVASSCALAATYVAVDQEPSATVGAAACARPGASIGDSLAYLRVRLVVENVGTSAYDFAAADPPAWPPWTAARCDATAQSVAPTAVALVVDYALINATTGVALPGAPRTLAAPLTLYDAACASGATAVYTADANGGQGLSPNCSVTADGSRATPTAAASSKGGGVNTFCHWVDVTDVNVVVGGGGGGIALVATLRRLDNTTLAGAAAPGTEVDVASGGLLAPPANVSVAAYSTVGACSSSAVGAAAGTFLALALISGCCCICCSLLAGTIGGAAALAAPSSSDADADAAEPAPSRADEPLLTSARRNSAGWRGRKQWR